MWRRMPSGNDFRVNRASHGIHAKMYVREDVLPSRGDLCLAFCPVRFTVQPLRFAEAGDQGTARRCHVSPLKCQDVVWPRT